MPPVHEPEGTLLTHSASRPIGIFIVPLFVGCDDDDQCKEWVVVMRLFEALNRSLAA